MTNDWKYKLSFSFSFVWALSLFSASCATSGAMPKTVTSEYLKTKVAAFSVSRTRETKYIMTFAVIKEVAEDMALEIEYENPTSRDNPIRATEALVQGQTELEIESPVLPGIKNKGVYRVVIKGLDKKTQELVFEHTQDVLFTLPPGF